MKRFEDPTVQVLAHKENFVAGKHVFNYGTDAKPRSKDTYVIVNTETDQRRFFLSHTIAKVAFDELVIHNATIETLSKNFTGRDLSDMHVFLNKNHVEPK